MRVTDATTCMRWSLPILWCLVVACVPDLGPEEETTYCIGCFSAPSLIGHTANLVSDGQVLIVGGMERPCAIPQAPTNIRPSVACELEALSRSRLFTPDGRTFEEAAALNVPRALHGSATLPGRDVVVAGGVAADGELLTSVEVFRAATGTWEVVGDTLQVGERMRLVPMGANKLLVLNKEVELFDLETGDSQKLPIKIGLSTITALDENRFVVYGWQGTPPRPGQRAPLRVMDLRNMPDAPRSTSDLKVHYGHGITRLSDGSLLITGGRDSSSEWLSDVFSWDPNDGYLQVRHPIPGPIQAHFTTTLLDGRALVIAAAGGVTYLYDPPSDRWSEGPQLDGSRVGASVTRLRDGDFFFFGGRTGGAREVSLVGYAQIVSF